MVYDLLFFLISEGSRLNSHIIFELKLTDTRHPSEIKQHMYGINYVSNTTKLSDIEGSVHHIFAKKGALRSCIGCKAYSCYTFIKTGLMMDVWIVTLLLCCFLIKKKTCRKNEIYKNTKNANALYEITDMDS